MEDIPGLRGNLAEAEMGQSPDDEARAGLNGRKYALSSHQPCILVVGSFVMDLVVRTPRLPKEGETVVGTEFGRAPGGKGANQAVAAARLGAKATMVGRVGNDLFGKDQLESLNASGVDTRYVVMDDEAPTGVGSITLDSSGNNRIIVVPGANMRVSPQDVENARPAFEEADVVVLQLEIPDEANERAMSIAKALGKPVILNPAPAHPLDDSMLRMATVVTPNETETEILTGMPASTPEDAEKAARALRARGVETVIVTMGGKGALLVRENETRMVPAWRVNVVDTTAAGDAFNGALAVALARGNDWAEALAFANAVAALSVTRFGAQPSMPTKEEVEAFLSRQSA